MHSKETEGKTLSVELAWPGENSSPLPSELGRCCSLPVWVLGFSSPWVLLSCISCTAFFFTDLFPLRELSDAKIRVAYLLYFHKFVKGPSYKRHG